MADDYQKQGNAFLAAGDLTRAQACYRKAVAADPDSAGARVALGFVLLEQDRLTEAKQYLEQAASIDPQDTDAHYLLGRVAQRENRTDEAIRHFDRALALKPDFAHAHYDRGVTLRTARRLDEALQSLDKALDLVPDFPGCRFNKALVLLLRGDFSEGLGLFESSVGLGATPQLSDWLARLPAHPEKRRWGGESLAGRRLLVCMDGGLGDCVMTARYLPKLAEKGVGNVVVLADPALARLIESLPTPVQVTSDAGGLSFDAFDVYCLMTSLPYLFGTRLDTIPATVPYLFVPREIRETWSRRLAGLKAPRVGLVWSGNKNYGRDALRSLPLHRLHPIVKIAGVSLVSLQKGQAARELDPLGWPVLDRMDECADFLDTAAVVENLDLVISVDTSVAHLAGALAKPVWMLNRWESEWRWQLDREDSPWYPTMRIFNQPAPGDWDSVVASVAREIARFAETGSSGTL